MTQTPRWQEIKESEELKTSIRSRQKTISGIRSYFLQQNYEEVETPLLVANPGTEPYLEVFGTTLKMADGRNFPGYLLTSPEYAMKKLLVAGFTAIFQICKSFRNGEGIGPYHNHEFTILEWYRTDASYTHLMLDCEQLIRHLALLHTGQDKTLTYLDRTYDISGEWPRLTVSSLFDSLCGVPADKLLDLNFLKQRAQALGVPLSPTATWDDAYTLLFMNIIEPKLALYTTPVFVTEYPLPQAALSKVSAHNPLVAERVELYLGGIELANGFSELTNADEQEARLAAEVQQRKEMGVTVYDYDHDFIAALKAGMPDSTGMALGVDRLVALFANTDSIKDTLTFPTETVFPVLE